VGAVVVLPFTGSNTGSLVVVATLTLALGGVLVVGARREETE
jgi:LPXTG-motif cell wall-anchored protein